MYCSAHLPAGTLGAAPTNPTLQPRCYRRVFTIPPSFPTLEDAVRRWISTCVMSRTRVPPGVPIRRESDLVNANPSLQQIWTQVLRHRVGQPTEIRARVYAVDRSPEMLRVARLRCDGPGVRFLQQDIRALCLPEPVDLVTANFDTLNHLLSPSDLHRAFRRVAAKLRSGGHFYFDIVTPCRPLGGERTYRRALRVRWRCLEQHVRWEPARCLLRILVVHRWAGGGGPVIERHAERAYEPARVGAGLLAAGLVIRGVHDEATLAPAGHCPAAGGIPVPFAPPNVKC